MTYLHLLATDLQTWVPPSDSHGEAGPLAAARDGATLGALHAILDEIEQAGVFAAVSSSIATALLDPVLTRAVAKDLDTYAPAEPLVYPVFAAKILGDGLDAGVILPVQAYHLRLAFARRLSRAIIDAGPAPSPEQRISELEKLEDAWQHVCGTSLIAAGALRGWLIEAGVHCASPANPHADGLLRAAQAGGRPCVSDDGQIAVPGWAESRRSPRYALRLWARVFIQGGQQTVVIENASETGLGLSGIKAGEAGAAITVELPGDDLVSGRIMWSSNGRAGVKLDNSLPARHPILKAANA